MAIEIYCDGGSSPKTTKAAGWAVAVSPSKAESPWRVYYGYLPPPSTNNVAEMTAGLNAMKLLWLFSQEGARRIPDATIYSDSRLVVDGMMEWRYKWEYQGTPDTNGAIWDEMIEVINNLKKVCNMKFQWVRGHKGNEGNELADTWAGHAKRNFRSGADGPSIKAKIVDGDFIDFLKFK